jgi:uncharacterized membrane protein YheB (UPF0754 family)
MIPETGQHVKCFMRSTMVLEGIIEEWSSNQVVLKSLDSESIMIIHRPQEDIMITKVVLEKISEEKPLNEAEKVKKKILDKMEIKERLQQVLDPISDEELNKTNLKRLRELVVEQDKKLITQKRQEHFGEPGASKRAASYSNPFLNKKSAYVPGVLPNTPGAIMATNHRKK